MLLARMQPERIDMTRRVEPHDLPEWMDQPCSYQEFHACLSDLAQVNRLTLASRPTLHWLDQLIAAHPQSRPLRIVDVGFGGGDMLRRIARWADRRGIAVELTGIDLNPYAARAAEQFTSSPSTIQWITGDAFTYTLPVDVVVSSLFTHHLGEAEIVRFLAWMEAVARCGWFISDLVREQTPLRLFRILAKAAGWHPFVRHDGPVSFRRAFREDDWQRMASAAGIPPAALSLQRWTPGRLCVGRLQ
jgi:SAM-dependent methyltransferase